MRDVDERRPERPAGEFAGLAEFARHGSTLASAQELRVLGSRRLHRRRGCQALLGTGVLVAAVFLGAGFVQNGSGRTSSGLGPGAGAGGTVRVSSPAAGRSPSTEASSPPVGYFLPAKVAESSAVEVKDALQHVGYTQITTSLQASATVPSGNAIDIEDGGHHSLLSHMVPVNTPLILVVSTGPSGR